MAKIFHAHLHGERVTKYDHLMQADVSDTAWSQILPQTPFYLLIPQDNRALADYEQGWKITEVMPVNVLGFQTHRDHFAIAFDKETIQQRLDDLRDKNIVDQEILDKYNIKENRDWNIKDSREQIQRDINWNEWLIGCDYRPFDRRYCYFSTVTMDYPRRELVDHVVGRKNFCLLIPRQIGTPIWQHTWVSDTVAESCTISNKTREQNYNFPLYFYSNHNSITQERQPNLSQPFLNDITAKLGYTPTPEAIFYYIYAIFHSPTYRSRYAEFLKIDFPRVPLTSNDKLFRQLAAYGRKLVALHLMKAPKLDQPSTQFVEQGGNRIVDAAHPKYVDGKVTINRKGDGFVKVPEEVWNFYVGGYPVCAKWLKDRKGRTLSSEDIAHYQRIVVALQETIHLMQKIDEVIPGFPIE